MRWCLPLSSNWLSVQRDASADRHSTQYAMHCLASCLCVRSYQTPLECCRILAPFAGYPTPCFTKLRMVVFLFSCRPLTPFPGSHSHPHTCEGENPFQGA